MIDWREIGQKVRERWREVVSEHAAVQLDRWSQLEGADPEAVSIEVPVAWLADGFA